MYAGGHLDTCIQVNIARMQSRRIFTQEEDIPGSPHITSAMPAHGLPCMRVLHCLPACLKQAQSCCAQPPLTTISAPNQFNSPVAQTCAALPSTHRHQRPEPVRELGGHATVDDVQHLLPVVGVDWEGHTLYNLDSIGQGLRTRVCRCMHVRVLRMLVGKWTQGRTDPRAHGCMRTRPPRAGVCRPSDPLANRSVYHLRLCPDSGPVHRCSACAQSSV